MKDAEICKKKGGKWLDAYRLCNFNKMKRPKYSSTEWKDMTNYITNTKWKFKVTTDHVIAKGTAKELMLDANLDKVLFESSIDIPIKLEIKGETIRLFEDEDQGESNTIKIGTSKYSREYIYQIAEEIIGEKLLLEERLKGSRPVAKRMVGKTIVVNAKQSPKPDVPLIVEGNRGYYLIAPKLSLSDLD